jgi:hypothetical protein
LIITGFVTRVTRRVPHEEQELPTLPEHQSSPPVFSGVRVSRSLVFCVVFCRSLFVPLSSGHYVVCPSIYGLWWPLWYLQTLLPNSYICLLNDIFDQHICTIWWTSVSTDDWYSNGHDRARITSDLFLHAYEIR